MNEQQQISYLAYLLIYLRKNTATGVKVTQLKQLTFLLCNNLNPKSIENGASFPNYNFLRLFVCFATLDGNIATVVGIRVGWHCLRKTLQYADKFIVNKTVIMSAITFWGGIRI